MIHVPGSITLNYTFAMTQLPAAGEIVICDRLMPAPGDNRAIAAKKSRCENRRTIAIGADSVAERQYLLKQVKTIRDTVDIANSAAALVCTGTGSQTPVYSHH